MRISQPPTISSVRMRNAKFLPVIYGKKSEGKRGEVTTISGTSGMRKMPTRRQFRRMELRFIGNTLTHFYEVNHCSEGASGDFLFGEFLLHIERHRGKGIRNAGARIFGSIDLGRRKPADLQLAPYGARKRNYCFHSIKHIAAPQPPALPASHIHNRNTEIGAFFDAGRGIPNETTGILEKRQEFPRRQVAQKTDL